MKSKGFQTKIFSNFKNVSYWKRVVFFKKSSKEYIKWAQHSHFCFAHTYLLTIAHSKYFESSLRFLYVTAPPEN